MKSAVQRVQENLLQPLSPEEAKQLMSLLAKLIAGHEATLPPS
jgi:hypothetical protein